MTKSHSNDQGSAEAPPGHADPALWALCKRWLQDHSVVRDDGDLLVPTSDGAATALASFVRLRENEMLRRGVDEGEALARRRERAMPPHVWRRCTMPLHALRENVCDKPLTRCADGSWRCEDDHYNPESSLVREALGRLVREVWVVWAKDQPNPKPHHLAPWEALAEPDREVDRRIGETLLGIRDWRVGQTPGNRATPSSGDPEKP